MRQCLANQQWDTDLPRCVPANNKGGSDNETKVAPRPKMNPETRSMKKVCKEGFQKVMLCARWPILAPRLGCHLVSIE